MKQQKNVFDQSFSINPSDYLNYFATTLNLKWNDVFELLTDYQNEGVKTTPMSPKMLRQNAEIISTNIVISGSALHDLDSDGINQILKFFPVLFVKTELGQFFINLKKNLFTHQTLLKYF